MRTKSSLAALHEQHARDAARLDEILSRITQEGALAEERDQRSTDRLERWREQDERRKQAYDDMAKFNQELLRRNEIVMRETLEALGDLRADCRAHTSAIFRLLDRFDDGSAGAQPA
jgi:hypothetical protein